MLVTTATTTTTTTTTSSPTLPMNLPLNQGANPTTTSFEESTDSRVLNMQPFIPGQCLFCSHPSASFDESVIHMQKAHGLFVPHQQHLAVDLETLFKYLHLVIFGYRECIHCGTERSTVQAAQQHMTGKGHCRFDISEEDSEFAEFYDFSPESEDDVESDDDSESNSEKAAAASPHQKPRMADEDSIRLPSGRIISRQSAAQTGPSSSTQARHRTRIPASQLEYSTVAVAEREDEREEEEEGKSGGEETDPTATAVPSTRALTRREKRERAAVTHQLASLSANDRNGLMHLSTAEQRSLLATQHRHAEKVQKEERRRQGKIDRKGNKNLYAYWHTETPVYQCG